MAKSRDEYDFQILCMSLEVEIRGLYQTTKSPVIGAWCRIIFRDVDCHFGPVRKKFFEVVKI